MLSITVERSSITILRVVCSKVGEPINAEAWHWYNNVVGDNRCPIVDTWWQTGRCGESIRCPLSLPTQLKRCNKDTLSPTQYNEHRTLITCGTVWHGTVWHGTARHGMARRGAARHGQHATDLNRRFPSCLSSLFQSEP